VRSKSSELVVPGKEELFELIIDSATDFAIFTTDTSRIVTSWNIGAERLFQYAEADIVGSPSDWLFVPEDRAAGVPEKEMLQAVANGRALDERWHQRRDGSRYWASGLLMPLKAPQGGFVKITRDRTDQHRAEQRLRENEERFRLLATSIPQLVFLTRPDGDRTWGSPQWIAFTGLNLEESLGFGWLDRFTQMTGSALAVHGTVPSTEANITSSTAFDLPATESIAGIRLGPNRWNRMPAPVTGSAL